MIFADYINKYKIILPVKRLSKGRYMFGNKIITLKMNIEENKLFVKTTESPHYFDFSTFIENIRTKNLSENKS